MAGWGSFWKLSKAVEEISGLTYHETYIMGDANIDFSKTNDKSRNSLMR